MKYWVLFFVFFSCKFFSQVIIDLKTNTLEVNLQERFVLEVFLEVDGSGNKLESLIKLPDLSKFNIIGNSSEQNQVLIKGIEKNQIICQYVLEAKKQGSIRIGSALVQVNGRIYKSEPFEIVVKEKKIAKIEDPKPNKDFVKLDLEVDNTKPYQYQCVKIMVYATTNNINVFANMEDILLPKQSHQNLVVVPNINTEIQQYIINKEVYYKKAIACIEFTSKRVGVEKIQPIKFAYKDSESSKHELLSTPIQILNVLKLPKRKATQFNNAVGEFKIELVQKTTTTESQSDPFEFSMHILGKTNNEIVLPKIIKSEDYRVYPLKKEIVHNDSIHSDLLVQNYVVHPKKEGKIDLKFEDFHFFNPETKTYQTKKLPILSFDGLESSLFEVNTDNFKQVVNDGASLIIEPKTSLGEPVVKNQSKSVFYYIRFVIAGLLILFLMIYLVYQIAKKYIIQSFLKKEITLLQIDYEFEKKLRQLVQKLESDFANENYQQFLKTCEEIHVYANRYFETKNSSLKCYLENNKPAEIFSLYEQEKSLINVLKNAPFAQKELYNNLLLSMVKIYSNIG